MVGSLMTFDNMWYFLFSILFSDVVLSLCMDYDCDIDPSNEQISIKLEKTDGTMKNGQTRLDTGNTGHIHTQDEDKQNTTQH